MVIGVITAVNQVQNITAVKQVKNITTVVQVIMIAVMIQAVQNIVLWHQAVENMTAVMIQAVQNIVIWHQPVKMIIVLKNGMMKQTEQTKVMAKMTTNQTVMIAGMIAGMIANNIQESQNIIIIVVNQECQNAMKVSVLADQARFLGVSPWHILPFHR